MPKRVLDGEAMWGSQRIGRLPDWMRPHYAWLYPLALSNGVFECLPRLVWAQCYAANMPHLTVEDAAAVVRAFNSEGLLFLWEHAGKQWGYWTNSDKPGRLPGRARRGRNEKAGPEPPKEELRKYLESYGCHLHPGFGFGFGIGSGSGLGSGEEARATPSALHFSGTWVKITAEQHANLTAAFPGVDVQRCYGECDLWQDAHPARRKTNQYAAMLNWLKREVQGSGNGTHSEAGAGRGPETATLTRQQEAKKWRGLIERRTKQIAAGGSPGSLTMWEADLRLFRRNLAECEAS